jgi:2-polyprenyl-3-methyl-5-hydroxy-6-metoxy-1,4-benzoquinol methylase
MNTTIRTDYFENLAHQPTSGPHYKGLPIFALPELHGFAGEYIAKYLPKQSLVLDLACGSGAMTQRLLDADYRVESADLVGDGFRLKEQVPFFSADFNTDFSSTITQRYDAVVGLEIIEHLENPRHFMRQCATLLKPGGLLFLSTPNINTPRSILRFLRNGTFRQFDDVDYNTSGHITPVSQWQLEKICSEQQWQVKELTGCGKPYGSGLRHLGAKAISLLTLGNPCLKNALLFAVLQKQDC